MKSEIDIFAIGHCCIDIIHRVDAFLSGDGKTAAQDTVIQPGGPAANAIVACARLGAKTAFAGQFGRDLFGELIGNGFQQEGVQFCSQLCQQTRVASCIVQLKTGARQVYAGTLSDTKTIFNCTSLFDATRILLLDGHEFPNALHFAQRAKALGKPVVLGIGSDRPGVRSLLPHCDTVIASEKFARSILTRAPENWPVRALQQLLRSGMKSAIITHGAQGSIGSDGVNIFRIPAVDIKAVDTTGAGDAFLGAIAFAHLCDWPLPKMMEFATLIAAEKCKHVGGRAGIPSQHLFNTPPFAQFRR